VAVYHKNLKYHEDKIEKHKITDSELSFLRDLQKELNTQDILGQANPRFWVIKGTEKIYHVEESDGYELYDPECCDILADSTEGICNYINENLLDDINSNRLDGEEFALTFEPGILGNEKIVVKWLDGGSEDDEMIEELDNLQEINNWLENQGLDYQIISYKIVPKIYENTMFLTQIDAENHLRENYYHYSDDAHTYAMTAWRNPRMDKLISILQEVEWDG
jgi:hypothetical protein